MVPQIALNGLRVSVCSLLVPALVLACSGSSTEARGNAGANQSAGMTGSGGSPETHDGAGGLSAFGGAGASSGAGGAPAMGGAGILSELDEQAGALSAGGMAAGGTTAPSAGGS